MRALIVIAAIALTTASSRAAQFRVTSSGEPVRGAQICLFKAGPVTNPVTRFFTHEDVACSPADAEVTIPSGEWNVFARKGSEQISERVELISDKQRPVDLALVAAGRIDSAKSNLGEEEKFFVYLPRTGSAMPLRDIVPIGEVVPLVVKKGQIVRVGAPLEVRANETIAIEPDGSTETTDVVVPVVITSLPAGGAEPPLIQLVDSGGKSHENQTPFRKAAEGATILAVFRGVGSGASNVTLSGSRWKTADAKVEARGRVVTLAKPLIARPSSKLIVHWWSPVDLATLRPPQRECKAELDPFDRPRRSDAAAFEATLLVCPDEPKPIAANCKSAGSVDLPIGELRGQAEFNDVPAGAHFVTFAYPGLPRIMKGVTATNQATSEANVELRYFSFYGKVLRGKKPVHGHVFGSVTDPETGGYVAVLTRAPGGQPYTVNFCDGSGFYTFVPDESPAENAEYNITIPENRVIVEVTDKKTGSTLKDSTVSLAAMYRDDDAAHYAGPAGKTDEQGRIVIEPVLTNRELQICATHPDYNAVCADRFEMKDTREKVIHLQLERAVKHRGRIASGKPSRGQLVWFSRDGQLTEMIREFTAEGEFIYKKPHAEGEIVALISADQPLYVFHHPRLLDEQVFEIAIPAAPRRTFNVTLSADSREEGGFIALQIGDVIATINSVGWHVMARRIQAPLAPGRTITIPDVLETGPITVIFVPFSAMKAYENRRVELPLIPEFGSLPRQRLSDTNEVTFR